MRTPILLALLALPALGAEALPPGWHLVTPSGAFEAVPVAGSCGSGRGLVLRSLRAGGGHATVVQRFQATPFLGRRIRLSALVRTREVRGWAALWMRVDGEVVGKSLAFDDMQDRPLRGTLACQPLQMVLDVPDPARTISAGLLLSGEGEVELSSVRFDPVPDTVPTTDLLGKGLPLQAPAQPVAEPPADPATALGSLRSGAPGLAGLLAGRPLAWYSATQLREPGLALDRVGEGRWTSASGDDRAELEGDTVRAWLWGQRGEVTVSHPEADVLLVEGTWDDLPVAVAVGPRQVRMAWGGLRAAFARIKPAPGETCARYEVAVHLGRAGDDPGAPYVPEAPARTWGDRLGDERELCGELASGGAPPLQAAVVLLGTLRRLDAAPQVPPRDPAWEAAENRRAPLLAVPRSPSYTVNGWVPLEVPFVRMGQPVTPPTPVMPR